MPLLLSKCLVAYTFLQGTLSLFWWTLFSLFFTNFLVLTKLYLCSFLVSLTETIMGFVFLVKNSCRALCCHRAVATPSFLSFFFFWSKKISQKHLLPKRNFRLKLFRTLMRVQRLTKCYGWSFNNGDLVLWVCNVFIFFNKNSFELNHQNRSWFSNPGGSTAVWTIPYFSYLERFLGIKEP